MELLIDIAFAAFISSGFIYTMALCAAEAVCAEAEAKRDATRLDF